jgi:hypothetical protein
MFIIMWQSQYGTEEVDECDTKKEARDLCAEYQMAYGEGRVFYKRRKAA